MFTLNRETKPMIKPKEQMRLTKATKIKQVMYLFNSDTGVGYESNGTEQLKVQHGKSVRKKELDVTKWKKPKRKSRFTGAEMKSKEEEEFKKELAAKT